MEDTSARPASLTVTIDGQTVLAKPKRFSTGSVGYNVTGKVTINGREVQVSGNLIEIKSKGVAWDLVD